MNRSLITHFLALYFFLLLTASWPFHLINKSAFLFSNSSSSFVHSTHESPLKTLSKSDKLPDTLSNLLNKVGRVVWYSLAKRRRISAISSEVNCCSEMTGFWVSACIVITFLINFFNYKWAVRVNWIFLMALCLHLFNSQFHWMMICKLKKLSFWKFYTFYLCGR